MQEAWLQRQRQRISVSALKINLRGKRLCQLSVTGRKPKSAKAQAMTQCTAPLPVFGRGWGISHSAPQGSSDSKRHGFGMPSRCTPAWAVSRSRRCTVGPEQQFTKSPFSHTNASVAAHPRADFSINADSGSPRPSRPILPYEVMFLTCILDI